MRALQTLNPHGRRRWVFKLLGGVASQPDAGGKTARLFNWHPLLMVLAYVVLMSEAVMAYRLPWHGAMQRCAGRVGASVPPACARSGAEAHGVRP